MKTDMKKEKTFDTRWQQPVHSNQSSILSIDIQPSQFLKLTSPNHSAAFRLAFRPHRHLPCLHTSALYMILLTEFRIYRIDGKPVALTLAGCCTYVPVPNWRTVNHGKLRTSVPSF